MNNMWIQFIIWVTYSKGKKVFIIPEGTNISIVDTVTGEIYATHPLCFGKGELIGSSSHDNRDMSQSVKELDKSVKELFADSKTGLYGLFRWYS